MEDNKFNYKPYMILVGVVLIFSAFAPFLFSKLSFGPIFGVETGAIGDTIGGVTAPFLSLVGSILVFAALRAQIQANNIVLKQFEKDDLEKIADVNNKMEILLLDLEAILDDVKSRGARIKEYGDLEVTKPFDFKVLKRTASNAYVRVQGLDRESIYKGFKLNFSSEDDWVKKYHELYTHLDFLPAFFKDIYSKYEENAKDLLELKTQTAFDIDSALSDATNTLKIIEDTFQSSTDSQSHPYYTLVNDFIIAWFTFLESDKRTVDVKMLDAKNLYFEPFLREIIMHYKNDPLLKKIIDNIRSVNMKITQIKFKSEEFGNNILAAHVQILESSEQYICVYDKLKNLKEWISKKISD